MATEAIERVTVDAWGRELKFTISAVSRDVHTHGEMTRADRQAIRNELAKAAEAIAAILRNQA